MKFQVITLFPKMIEALVSEGVIGQARAKDLIQVSCINPRDFTEDVHKTVDDRPYGGGDGMVLLAEPLQQALQKALQSSETAKPWVVYLTPQGVPLNQQKVQELSQKESLILICGRYGGVDQRALNQALNEELSIGDYVLSGGELAAGVVIDAVSRQVPGVLGHLDSASTDSFSEKLNGLLEAPSFTRPRCWLDENVPEILLSGNHAKIEKWKKAVSWLVTLKKRPDLILKLKISADEAQEIKRFWMELEPAQKEVLGLAALSLKDLELLEDDNLKR